MLFAATPLLLFRRAAICRPSTCTIPLNSTIGRARLARRRAACVSPSTTMTTATASSMNATEATATTATTTSTKQERQQRFAPLAPGAVAPDQYEARLAEKVERVRDILSGVLPRSSGGEGEDEREKPFPIDVFASPDRGFRLRAEFRVWHEGEDVYYVMFDTRDPKAKPPPKVRIDHYPIGPPLMNALMKETIAAVREDCEKREDGEKQNGDGDVDGDGEQKSAKRQKRSSDPSSRGGLACGPLRRKLFQANFHTTLSGECIVTLLYHRNLGGEGEGRVRGKGRGRGRAKDGVGGGGGGDSWDAAARRLRARLLAAGREHGCTSVDVIGRSRGVARVHDKDHVTEVLEVEFGGGAARRSGGGGGEGAAAAAAGEKQRRTLHYRQTEGSFSQPNGAVCQSMLGWAWKAAALGGRRRTGGGGGGGAAGEEDTDRRERTRRSDDLLELYCGNGNFTAALAPAFRRVVATEVSRSGVASAHVNLERNRVEGDDVAVARADADRVAAALAALDGKNKSDGKDDGNDGDNDKNAFSGVVPTTLGGTVDLSSYDLRTLFVDPPRAGCGEVTAAVMARFDRVLYVSCNPSTLAADVGALVTGGGGGGGGAEVKKGDDGEGNQGGTHEVTAAAVFDQFPYTDHIECGVLLERRREDKE